MVDHGGKVENHVAAVALHIMFYNFVCIYQTLRVSPAMAARLTDRLWEISDIVNEKAEPIINVHESHIGDGYLVRALFPSGDSEDIRGFVTRDDAINWIRCETVVWLWQKLQSKLSA